MTFPWSNNLSPLHPILFGAVEIFAGFLKEKIIFFSDSKLWEKKFFCKYDLTYICQQHPAAYLASFLLQCNGPEKQLWSTSAFFKAFYQLLYIFTLPSSTAFVVWHGCGFENWSPPRFCTSPDNIGRLILFLASVREIKHLKILPMKIYEGLRFEHALVPM